jgi:hypothetical protein
LAPKGVVLGFRDVRAASAWVVSKDGASFSRASIHECMTKERKRKRSTLHKEKYTNMSTASGVN